MNIDAYTSRLKADETAIFLLHGVIEKPVSAIRNYNRKHILKDELASLISALQTEGYALSMDEYVHIKKHNEKLPPRSFVMTFDDGFENNVSVAAPVLEDYQVPGIIYLTTGFLDENRMSWIDQIDYAIEQTQKEQIIVRGTIYSLHDDNQKITTLQAIRENVKLNKALFLDIDRYINEVFDACGLLRITSNNDSPLDRKMSWEQAKALHKHPLFTLGGHTHSHVIMSYVDDDELESEVSTCLDKINYHTNDKTIHFCYPEGLEHCYNDTVIDCLKRHGILCSPSAIDGTNPISTDLFHLKRIFVV